MQMSDFEVVRWGLELVLVGLATVLWFLIRKLIADVEKMMEDVAKYKLYVSEHYTRKTDFDGAIERLSDEMRAGFNRLFDRIAAKADK